MSEHDDWQPIETAPKDESLILVYGPCEVDGESYPAQVGIAFYHKIRDRWIGENNGYVIYTPTHWRPLPPPPQPLLPVDPDFDFSLFPTTVEEVRRAEKLLAENPVEVPEELLDPSRLWKTPQPKECRPLDANWWRESRLNELLALGVPVSAVADGLRCMVEQAVKEVPALNIKVAPADAVAIQWTTEPPKEDASGWFEDKDGSVWTGVWERAHGRVLVRESLSFRPIAIARYLMLPRPEVKS